VNALLPWLLASAAEFHDETAGVRTITFDVPGWRGHLAGQHVDIRLTAEDGFVAQRSYSVASRAGSDSRIQLTVERIADGEISPFLLDELRIGDTIELRGPIGGYFNWSPANTSPLMLVAGGSGIVPLMSMLRTRAAAFSRVPTRLLYSSRSENHIIYRGELRQLQDASDALGVTHALTREVRADWAGERGRIGRSMLMQHGFAPHEQPDVFVCGPTPFVDVIADHLVAIGHRESKIKTERFGPTGGLS
jgi:ferredoxin-NADP reductase